MAHVVASMTGMPEPSKRFGKIVAGIDDPREMFHDKVFLLTPFWNGKMLDDNVPSMQCGMFLLTMWRAAMASINKSRGSQVDAQVDHNTFQVDSGNKIFLCDCVARGQHVQ